jgi:hypothetical protein
MWHCSFGVNQFLQAESLSHASQSLTRKHLTSVQGAQVEILNEQGLLLLNQSKH